MMWGWAILALIVAGIAVLAAAASRREEGDERSASLSILEQRYAKGDIERDEYLQKLRDLVHSH